MTALPEAILDDFESARPDGVDCGMVAECGSLALNNLVGLANTPEAQIYAFPSAQPEVEPRVLTPAEARVAEFGKIDDLVRIGKSGTTAHATNGKLLSNNELDMIAENQEQIRQGMRERSAKLQIRESVKAALIEEYGEEAYAERYAKDPDIDPDAWKVLEYRPAVVYEGRHRAEEVPRSIRILREHLDRVQRQRELDEAAYASRSVLDKFYEKVSIKSLYDGGTRDSQHRRNVLIKSSRVGGAVLAVAGAVTAISVGYIKVGQQDSASGEDTPDPYANICEHPASVDQAQIWGCFDWLDNYYKAQTAKYDEAMNDKAPNKSVVAPAPTDIHMPNGMTIQSPNHGEADGLWKGVTRSITINGAHLIPAEVSQVVAEIEHERGITSEQQAEQTVHPGDKFTFSKKVRNMVAGFAKKLHSHS